MRDELLDLAAYVAGFSTVVLAFVEWKIPGFVSNVLPFYWLLVVPVILGLVDATVDHKEGNRAHLRPSLVVFATLALSIVILEDGGVFGVMRIPLAIVTIFIPLTIFYGKLHLLQNSGR